MMKNFILYNRGFRYVSCAVFAVLALLLLGAGRLSGEKRNSPFRSELFSSTCGESVSVAFSGVVPAGQRAGWAALLRSAPELSVRIHSSGVHPVSGAERR